nr:glycosyltransferase [Sphingomonas sp.]
MAKLLYEPGHVTKKGWWTLRDFVRRASVLRRARNYDGVVIHREAALIGPAIYERLLARTGTPIIYDFDDAIWLQQPEHRSMLSPLRFQRKTKAICRLAKAVTVGNPFLAAFARKHNSSVTIVPSTIELDDYPAVAEPANQDQFVVCWTGTRTTLAHFEHAREALESLARQLRLVVKVICSEPPERPIAGAEMRFVPWSAATEAQDVGDCHVGIMPLPDNEFTRGKSGMKALQYMATGRPVVASPVGVNSQLVRPGENGFLAANSQEFVQALSALAASRDLRARLGAAARGLIEHEYSAAAGAGRFAAVVNALV